MCVYSGFPAPPQLVSYQGQVWIISAAGNSLKEQRNVQTQDFRKSLKTGLPIKIVLSKELIQGSELIPGGGGGAGPKQQLLHKGH